MYPRSVECARPQGIWLRAALRSLVFGLLAIEFANELSAGTHEAAWPLLRNTFDLSYTQVGLLLSVPILASQFIEPVLGVLADLGHRRRLVLGGGALFVLGQALAGLSQGFWSLLAALVLIAPASGAFVSLAQAALMDAEPQRREQNMARWALAGSAGMVAGPLLLGAAAAAGLGWRGAFLALAALSAPLVLLSARLPLQAPASAARSERLLDGLGQVLRALRRRDVLRWMLLLELGDLMIDVLYGFLALYYVDVAGASAAEAAIALAVWTGMGLAGDLLVIPLLERVPGLLYLRVSAGLTLGIYALFLLVPGWVAKLGLLGLLGLLHAGWYPILKAQLYGALPGQSGTVMALSSLGSGLAGVLAPLLGAVAERHGLDTAMGLLLAGPFALALAARPPRRA